MHNSTFFIAMNPLRVNDTQWQKTLGMHDFYEAGPTTEFPLGNLQMLGKLQGAVIKPARPWAPNWALDLAMKRTVDIYLTTEDLPSLDSAFFPSSVALNPAPTIAANALRVAPTIAGDASGARPGVGARNSVGV